MKTMPDHLLARTKAATYPVYIAKGLLARLGQIVAEHCQGRNCVVVTDDQVAPLYLAAVTKSLTNAGFSCASLVLPAGEKSKSIAVLARLYDKFHQQGLTRIDPVLALGGGVIGDLAGFAAATWLRGVPLFQVPTSLLAQVDSSLGGKTGLDLEQGKNLVGAFYQPRAVLMDPAVLTSLPPRRFAEGMAEVIKYALIGDLELLARLEEKDADLTWLVRRCAKSKINIVAEDELDMGRRMLLNFGHTAGHAIEKVSGYSHYSHGEAVAAGMVIAARIGELTGQTRPGTASLISRLLESYALPAWLDLPGQELVEALDSDKKKLGDEIHFVLLKKPGEAFVSPMPAPLLKARLLEVLANG